MSANLCQKPPVRKQPESPPIGNRLGGAAASLGPLRLTPSTRSFGGRPSLSTPQLVNKAWRLSPVLSRPWCINPNQYLQKESSTDKKTIRCTHSSNGNGKRCGSLKAADSSRGKEIIQGFVDDSRRREIMQRSGSFDTIANRYLSGEWPIGFDHQMSCLHLVDNSRACDSNATARVAAGSNAAAVLAYGKAEACDSMDIAAINAAECSSIAAAAESLVPADIAKVAAAASRDIAASAANRIGAAAVGGDITATSSSATAIPRSDAVIDSDLSGTYQESTVEHSPLRVLTQSDSTLSPSISHHTALRVQQMSDKWTQNLQIEPEKEEEGEEDLEVQRNCCRSISQISNRHTASRPTTEQLDTAVSSSRAIAIPAAVRRSDCLLVCRGSAEGFNQEIEKLVRNTGITSDCDKLGQKSMMTLAPDGHRAPIAHLLTTSSRSVDTQTPSSGVGPGLGQQRLRDNCDRSVVRGDVRSSCSDSPYFQFGVDSDFIGPCASEELDEDQLEESRSKSVEEESMSPAPLVKFAKSCDRPPPEGCERVEVKMAAEVSRLDGSTRQPLTVVTSPMKSTGFPLCHIPSERSAFYPLLKSYVQQQPNTAMMSFSLTNSPNRIEAV